MIDAIDNAGPTTERPDSDDVRPAQPPTARPLAALGRCVYAATAALTIAFCLSGCGGSDPPGGSEPSPRIALECLSSEVVAMIQSNPGLMVYARGVCDRELNISLGAMNLAPDEVDAVFATVATYAGFSASTSASALAGDEQFAVQAQQLLHHLQAAQDTQQLLLPEIASGRLHLIGVFGGIIGNRAQLVYEGTVNQLLLDPWTGVVAKAAYSEIFSGTPIPAARIQAYVWGPATIGQQSSASVVLAALADGGYRPSDLFYFQPSPKFYEAVGAEGSTADLDYAQELAAELKTPGGYAKAVQEFGLPGVPVPKRTRFSAGELQNWVSWDSLQVANHQLSCLANGAVNAVRANPNAIIALWQGCDAELSGVLASLQFSTTELHAVFAMIVAHDLAPYGSNSAVLLADLLQQPTLECSGYSLLTGYLLDILSQGTPHAPLRMIGFHHPVFGDHTELFYDEGARALLLDPTIGLVAIVPPYDAFSSGQAVPAGQIATFYQYAPSFLYFVEDVYNSIRFGKYRPSDLMYFVPYPQFWAGQWVNSATAADWLMYQYMTPGGYRKAVQLGFSG